MENGTNKKITGNTHLPKISPHPIISPPPALLSFLLKLVLHRTKYGGGGVGLHDSAC